MTSDLLLALISFVTVTTITPGPNNLMLMASGTNYGFRASIPHIAGITGGIVAMLVIIGVGLMKVFELIPHSYLILKSMSFAYLLYLAWKIATAAPPDMNTAASRKASRPLTFLQAALFQWVNPKAWAMSLTAVSAYTLRDQSVLSLLAVCIAFIAVTPLSISLWAVLGTQLRHVLGNPRRLRVFNISAALLLVASLWPILAMKMGN